MIQGPALVLAITTTSIGQVLGAPQTFDGHHITLTGQVEDLQQHVTRTGLAYTTFTLCNGQCVHVFANGTTGVRDGETITVQGTFATVNHGNGYTYYNQIEADEGAI